ncbi:Adhesion and hyphal regulator 1 [Candida viswanathii]|uniref:Adhesion and hyphal regulator 1 n=1 Tax=Candida viswanathii TaxID=5486 RepID=A0A367XVQ1_9ASCO|nr:Adhesion and hyphal regulator 1 [Candida viswanathii]
MAKKKLNPSIKRSRTRSGCVTCRDRHIKCDEQQPICKNCIKSNRKCYRGIRLNFTQYTFYDPDEHKPKNGDIDQQQQHPSQQLVPSHSHSGTPSIHFHPLHHHHQQQQQPLMPEPRPIRHRHRILDQSITIASLYDDTRNYRPYLHLHSQADLRESDLQFQEDTYNSYISTSDRKSSSSSRSVAPPSSSLSVIRPSTDHQPTQPSQPLQSTPSSVRDNSQFMSQLTSQNTTPFNPDFFTNELYTTHFSTAHLHQQYSMPQLLILPPPQPPPPPTHSLSAPPPSSHHHSSLQLPLLHHPHHHSMSNLHQHLTAVAPPHLQQLLSQQQYQNQQQIPPQSLLQMPQQHQSQQFDYPQMSFNQPSMLPLRYDISNYIQLIENEKYYTLLDLTNEIDIWKSIVPTLCLRASDKDSFLLDCLMSCSRQMSPNLPQLTHEQLNKWLQIKDSLVGVENIQLFEHLLISVVLILYGIYLTITRDRLTDYHKIVMNNQAKLFAKVLEKLNGFIENNRANNSTVLVNCIYTITILKFYINKNFDLSLEFRNQNNNSGVSGSSGNSSTSAGVSGGTPSTANNTATVTTGGGGGGTASGAVASSSDSGPGAVAGSGGASVLNSPDDIVYPTTYFNADLSYIVNISQHEMRYLNSSYQVFGYEQVRNEAQLYKDLLWYLIKVDFILNHPEGATDLIIDYNSIHQIDAHSSSFTAQHAAAADGGSSANTRRYSFSQRYYARSFIREFIRKLMNMNNSDLVRDVNHQLQSLFVQVDESYMEPEVKLQYRYYFTWTLRYVHPINA